MPSRNAGNLIDRRSAPSARSQPLRSGSAASTCSSVNTAIFRRYTVSRDAKPDRRRGCADRGSALLVAQRERPPELAGLWELPGGKVAPGESDAAGLARELHEELGVDVTVGDRLGDDVALNETMTLRAYRVTQTGGALQPQRPPRAALGDAPTSWTTCRGCPPTGRGCRIRLRHCGLSWTVTNCRCAPVRTRRWPGPEGGRRGDGHRDHDVADLAWAMKPPLSTRPVLGRPRRGPRHDRAPKGVVSTRTACRLLTVGPRGDRGDLDARGATPTDAYAAATEMAPVPRTVSLVAIRARRRRAQRSRPGEWLR